MGTGSAGGGSGGGWSGGGPGTSGFGNYQFDGDTVTKNTPSQAGIRDEITALLSSRSISAYLRRQFTSPLVASVYGYLIDVAEHRTDADPLECLPPGFQVDPGPGFLVRLADALAGAGAESEPDGSVRGTVRMCLEDFLIHAIGDNPELYTSATRREALEHLDRSVLGRTLGYFLTGLIIRLLERESPESLPAEVEIRLHAEAQRRADQAIGRFEKEFVAMQRGRHRDFFAIVASQPSWFLKEIAS